MSLHYLLESYSQIPKVKVIGKELLFKENIYEVVGLTLKDKQLEMLIFEYDEAYRERLGMLENDEECARENDTQRDQERSHIIYQRDSLIDNIREVVIDGVAYTVIGTSGGGNLEHDEDLFLLAKLFEKGWKPKQIGKVDAALIYSHSIVLEGEFKKFPQVSDKVTITLKRGETLKNILVEQPIALEVDKEYNEKIYFDMENEKRWIYINAVKPYYFLEEMLEQFKNPKYLEYYTEAELNGLIEETTKNIKKACPDGKCFVLVEYESDTDENISLHSKEWLDNKPIEGNLMIFGATPDKDRIVGKLGKQMKVALLAEPFDEDVKHIEAELFAFFKRIKNEAITF